VKLSIVRYAYSGGKCYAMVRKPFVVVRTFANVATPCRNLYWYAGTSTSMSKTAWQPYLDQAIANDMSLTG
jgi:hypothetical protein